jgi:cytidine deaminase
VTSVSEFKDEEGVFSPCGACRQVMAEAEIRSEKKIKIIVHSPQGQTRIFEGISQLLPFSFKNPSLKKK